MNEIDRWPHRVLPNAFSAEDLKELDDSHWITLTIGMGEMSIYDKLKVLDAHYYLHMAHAVDSRIPIADHPPYCCVVDREVEIRISHYLHQLVGLGQLTPEFRVPPSSAGRTAEEVTQDVQEGMPHAEA